MRWLALTTLLACPAFAEGEAAGSFDYYVMALSWSANWCALEGEARGDDQCDARHDHDFVLHGLWPQYEAGWPSYCRTMARDPARRDSEAMADIMGSGGSAWYQWKKHGRCAGMPASDYFGTARRAFGSVVIPQVFRDLARDVKLPASVVEEAFVEANPGLTPAMISITCDQGYIQEARICLSKDLEFRACGVDAARDCRLQDAVMAAGR